MENEKSRRLSVERKSAGAGSGTNDRNRNVGRSSEGGSSSSNVWRIDREDHGGEKGAQRDASVPDRKNTPFYSGFEKPGGERKLSTHRSSDGRNEGRGASDRNQYGRSEGSDRTARRRDDDSRGSSERKPYSRSEGSDRPERRRADDSRGSLERKPFSRDGGHRPVRRRDEGSHGASERKPYSSAEGGERPERRRDDDSRGSSERKPYGRSDVGDRPWKRDHEGGNERRSLGPREGKSRPERRVYDRREDDGHKRPFERKSYARGEDRRDDDRPRRTYNNFSSEAGPAKSFGGKRKRMEKVHDDGLIRLNKFIANSGVCSRREADDYIIAGVITVNGAVVNELGARVNPSDDIRFNGERLKGEKKVYVLLNKSKNYVTTVEDPHADRTVMDLVSHICTERIYPVGRLDRNSTGVLLFTNDGELTKQLTHPSYNKLKVYHVFLDKPVTQRDLRALVEGVNLEDGLAQADAADYVGDKKSEVGLEIHSGRNRIVRRMFAALDYEVVKLDRVFFAGLTKKNLRRGECRLLTDKEIEMLKMGAYE